MLPPVTFPKLDASSSNMPQINVPNPNTVNIPGQTQRAGAYLVQAVVAPLPQFPPKDPYARR
jgi:hypothetical protein